MLLWVPQLAKVRDGSADRADGQPVTAHSVDPGVGLVGAERDTTVTAKGRGGGRR